MSAQILTERVQLLIPKYQKLFAQRGGITPTDPLEFHLYHLVRYWSRLVGFCRQDPSRTEGLIKTDLGACIEVGTQLAHELVKPESLIYSRWQNYWTQTQSVLHKRPVSIESVEATSRIFDECVSELKFDAWTGKPKFLN